MSKDHIFLNIKNEKFFVFNTTKFIKDILETYNNTDTLNIEDIDVDIFNSTFSLQNFLVKEVAKELIKRNVTVKDCEWMMDEKDLEEIKKGDD